MYLQKPCQTEKYFRFFYWRVIYFLASHILFTKTVPNYTEKANILRLSGKNIILGGGVLVKKDRGNWWGTPCLALELRFLRVNHLSELILKQDHPALLSYILFFRLPNIFSVEPTFGDELIEVLLHGGDAIIEIHALGKLPVYLHGGLVLPV